MKNKIFYIPSFITSIRVILAFILLFSLIKGFFIFSIILFLIAIATDGLDGYIARKLCVSSSSGAYFDIIADFILVLTVFIAFVISGIYPYWIIILILLDFIIGNSHFGVNEGLIFCQVRGLDIISDGILRPVETIQKNPSHRPLVPSVCRIELGGFYEI